MTWRTWDMTISQRNKAPCWHVFSFHAALKSVADMRAVVVVYNADATVGNVSDVFPLVQAAMFESFVT